MTVDGVCDHTAGIPDEDLHRHYAELLDTAGAILYGRITYQLMQYWQTLIGKPSGEKAMDEFAVSIDRIPKIVFSRTLTNLDWPTAKLANHDPATEVAALKQQPGKDILVGSPSLIISLLNLQLIDEFQLCIHPVAGTGQLLFKEIKPGINFKLNHTKSFDSGAVILYYEPVKK